MERRPRILLDCDGPLTEGFVALACDYIREESQGDINADPQNVDQWDLMRSLKVPKDIEDRVYKRLEHAGTAFNFAPNKGAVEFMEKLQAWATVYIVTSPLGGPHWANDREQWLYHWFKIPSQHVASIKAKFIVRGDAFVEDKLSHLVEWKAEHPTGHAILWRIGPNRHDTWPVEASTYPELHTLLWELCGMSRKAPDNVSSR